MKELVHDLRLRKWRGTLLCFRTAHQLSVLRKSSVFSQPSHPNTLAQCVDWDQQELRKEIVTYCADGFEEDHPEAYGEVCEQAARANVFDTRGRVLSDKITDIFYREWRMQKERYDTSNETKTAQDNKIKGQDKEEQLPRRWLEKVRAGAEASK